jgi:hypothetical protein
MSSAWLDMVSGRFFGGDHRSPGGKPVLEVVHDPNESLAGRTGSGAGDLSSGLALLEAACKNHEAPDKVAQTIRASWVRRRVSTAGNCTSSCAGRSAGCRGRRPRRPDPRGSATRTGACLSLLQAAILEFIAGLLVDLLQNHSRRVVGLLQNHSCRSAPARRLETYESSVSRLPPRPPSKASPWLRPCDRPWLRPCDRPCDRP